MTELESFVSRVYGNRLVRVRNQEDVYHLYSIFRDSVTSQKYFLRTVELPSYMHISDCIVERTLKKYQKLLPSINFIAKQRTFQGVSYLIRSPFNIILVSQYLRIKQKECNETLQKKFFLKLIQFLVNSYEWINKNSLPEFQLNQIGITESGQFVICDPAVYFKNSNTNQETHTAFDFWIKKNLMESLCLPDNNDQKQSHLREIFGKNYVNTIVPIVNYLLSGSAQISQVKSKIVPLISKISQGATTQSASVADLNDIIQRSSKISFQNKDQKQFRRVGSKGKLLILFLIVGLIIGGGFLIFKFLNRNILCQQSFYLDDLNKCSSCSVGCTRCSNGMPTACSKCQINMYLVVNSQKDIFGSCLNACHGRLIKKDVCISDRSGEQESLKLNI